MDFFDGEVAFEEDYAIGFAEGDVAVLLPDAGVELVLLQLKAILILIGLRAGLGLCALVATAGTDEAGLEAGQEKEGEVGLKVAADEAVKGENVVGAELTATTLVGLRGVSKAVAEDDFAAVESGLDDFRDGLGAVGKHEGHFCHGCKAGRARVEDQSADAVAGCGAAGLAGDDYCL